MTNISSKAVLVICAIALNSGCSAVAVRTLKSGDRVSLNYTCRLPDGSIAATTEKEIDIDETQRKSALYVAQNLLQPFELTIGAPEKPGPAGVLSFEQEIAMRLGAAVVGIPSGGQRNLELTAETPSNLPDRDRYLDMATIRKRPKEMIMSIEEYRNLTGTTPEIGQSVIFDPLVPGRVSVTDNRQVTIKFAPDTGPDVVTPFGTAKISDAGDQYAIELQAKKGQLVRSGPLAGVISIVKDNSFSIDYGNPLAGERLLCRVTAELAPVKAKEAEKK